MDYSSFARILFNRVKLRLPTSIRCHLSWIYLEAESGIEPLSTALQAVTYPYISTAYTALPLHLFVLFQLPISA